MLPLRVGLRLCEWDDGVLLLLVLLLFGMSRKRAYEKHDDEKKYFEEVSRSLLLMRALEFGVIDFSWLVVVKT